MNGTPWRAHGLVGRSYAPLPREIEAELVGWLRTLAVPGSTPLKAPDVLRLGPWVVKFFTQPSLFGWLRAPRAVRSAERHFWCLPLASPRPRIAVGRPLRRASVLVREHVEGVTLRELWDSAAGLAAHEEAQLASFLAAMERHRVIHGDLHPRNLLWSGNEWLLLDVDGLRHGLHDSTRVLTALWARLLVHLGDEQRVRALHARAVRELGSGGRVEWSAVERAGARMRSRRGGIPAA